MSAVGAMAGMADGWRRKEKEGEGSERKERSLGGKLDDCADQYRTFDLTAQGG